MDKKLKFLSQIVYELYSQIYINFCSTHSVRNIIAPFLKDYDELIYLHSGTGLKQELEIKKLYRFAKSKKIMLIGVEKGYDALKSWKNFMPAYMVGIDLQKFESDWMTVKNIVCKQGISLDFVCMDGMELGFKDSQFDLVYSQSLLEHITDLNKFLKETKRVLKPGGMIYSLFGPLWYTYGGPHIGALEYDHLLMPIDEYIECAKKVGNGWEYYVVNGLYNQLRFDEYLEIFKKYFRIHSVLVAGSPEGRNYRKKNPGKWRKLLSVYDEKDLLIRLVRIIAEKV